MFYSPFDRWVALEGSGAASSGHFRPMCGGGGGVRGVRARIENIWFSIASKRPPRRGPSHVRGRVLELMSVLAVVGRFPRAPDRLPALTV